MKTKDSLKILIESFSKLKKNWGSYNEKEITTESILSAYKVLDVLSENIIQIVDIYPMRDGGIQIEIGDFREIEILNYTVTEIQFDIHFNIINKNVYEVD